MQGKKNYEEKLFTTVKLSSIIPADNFYRKIKREVNFDFIYGKTNQLYGKKGKHSIDPVVFFKLCFLREHEKISSDKKLIDFCKIRLDARYFLGYNIDEKLPAWSTISKTRHNFPLELYTEICDTINFHVEKLGLTGKTSFEK